MQLNIHLYNVFLRYSRWIIFLYDGSEPGSDEKSVSCRRFARSDMNIESPTATSVHLTQCPVCGQHVLESFLTVPDHAQSGESFQLSRCPDCQLVFTQDMPDANHIGPYYDFPEYVSHSDTQQGLFFTLYHWIRSYMVRRKAKLVRRWKKKPGKLLDYGCGTGFFLHHMVRLGWQGTGLEINEKARSLARNKWQLNVYDPKSLGDYREEFDVITLWHVLEHVHTLTATTKQLVRALKPGGLLIIAVPNYTSFDARYYGPDWAAYDVPRHLWHFAPASILRLVRGVTCVSKRSMPFDSYYVSLLSEKYRNSGLPGRLRGMWNALRSNMMAMFRPSRASSVIYVFQKPLV
ncbi:MAG: class I SAM-dependent methyltransferase [Saprospiraceae bacterium]